MSFNNISNVLSGSIPALFGNGLLGTAVTGLVRIPAFMANCTAILMVGELAIRGLTSTISAFGFKPDDDSWISTASKKINGSGVRPYNTYTNQQLVTAAIGFAALGIIGSEFVRVTGGQTPQIYNNILAFLGPIRIDTTPYFTAIAPMIGKIW